MGHEVMGACIALGRTAVLEQTMLRDSDSHSILVPHQRILPEFTEGVQDSCTVASLRDTKCFPSSRSAFEGLVR